MVFCKITNQPPGGGFLYFTMNEFELEFVNDLKRLELKRYEVCEQLGVSAPTLKARLKNPASLTLKEVDQLKNLGFTLNTIAI